MIKFIYCKRPKKDTKEKKTISKYKSCKDLPNNKEKNNTNKTKNSNDNNELKIKIKKKV